MKSTTCVLPAILVAMASGAAASDALFATPRDYAALAPRAVAAGDFDGDGTSDLVVANLYRASVTVRLNGGAAFVAPVGDYPSDLAVADFNRDGRIDAAVAVYGSDTVAVLLGNGDGTTQAARHHAADPEPMQIAVADFDGDLIPDVLVTSRTGLAGVLLGNGDGTLQAYVPIVSSEFWRGLVVGDFDGDGRADIAAPADERIAVLSGRGDGTFLAPIYTAVEHTSAVAAGDFDGDGALDLAAVQGNSDRVGVLSGRGDGTFQAPTGVQSVSVGTRAPVVADFDNDGNLDVACGNFGGHDPVLLGAGDGTLQNPTYVVTGAVVSNGHALAVVDWNRDGSADLVFAVGHSDAPLGVLSIRLGKGDGTFARAPGLWTGISMTAVATADFNGDGAIDIATAGQAGQGYLAIVLGRGDGTFESASEVRIVPSGTTALLPGDFDRDGHVDLVLVGTSVDLFRGRGDGSLGPAERIGSGGDSDAVVVAADLNADGIPDLLAMNTSFSRLVSLLGNGDGTFVTINGQSTSGTRDLVAADVDGDGVPDAAMTSFDTNSVLIAFGNGDGTFQPAAAAPVGTRPRVLTAADFTGDGRMDLAVLHQSEELRVLVSNGDGTFQSSQYFVMDEVEQHGIRAADLNGDGVLDLVGLGPATLSILQGAVDGSFRLQVTGFSAGVYSPRELAIGDFTGDGRPDIAVAGNGGVALLANTTP